MILYRGLWTQSYLPFEIFESRCPFRRGARNNRSGSVEDSPVERVGTLGRAREASGERLRAESGARASPEQAPGTREARSERLRAESGARASLGPVILLSPSPAAPPKRRRADLAVKPIAIARGFKLTPATPHVLSPAAAQRFLDEVVLPRENAFYRAGVGYDGETGMTFDGHPIDYHTGQLIGEPRTLSAASKESLHIGLLVRAVAGDRTAQTMLAHDVAHRESARAHALEVLTKKIATYERFDREYPGYGGFLPWYRVKGDRIEPTDDWRDRVPGLDNGQLAWSLYLAANVLDEQGEHALARRYRDKLEQQAENVVRIFYDPEQRKMRSEARLARGAEAPPGANVYENNQPDYPLDDACEGVLLLHFADHFGRWEASGHPEGRDAIWEDARRIPATFVAKGGGAIPAGERVTLMRGHTLSSHEDWAFLVLPFLDVPIAKAMFANTQAVRTCWAAEQGHPGLAACAHQPKFGNVPLDYTSIVGVDDPTITKLGVQPRRIFVPYAAFPLALVDKQQFATWLSLMLDPPGMLGPNGMAECFDPAEGEIAPVLTWDGKALQAVAWMGGFTDDIRRFMIRDGFLPGFLQRVAHDYSRFDGIPIEGRDAPLSAPNVAFPRPRDR